MLITIAAVHLPKNQKGDAREEVRIALIWDVSSGEEVRAASFALAAGRRLRRQAIRGGCGRRCSARMGSNRWRPGGGDRHRSVLDCAAGRRLRAVRVVNPKANQGGGWWPGGLSELPREEVQRSDLNILSVVAGRR